MVRDWLSETAKVCRVLRCSLPPGRRRAVINQCRPPDFTRRSPADRYIYVRIYTGSTILDLFDLVERAERLSSRQRLSAGQQVTQTAADDTSNFQKEASESEEFSQTPGLSAADRDLSLFLVVHPQLIGTFEPRDNLTDTVDIHEVGPVSPPE